MSSLVLCSRRYFVFCYLPGDLSAGYCSFHTGRHGNGADAVHGMKSECFICLSDLSASFYFLLLLLGLLVPRVVFLLFWCIRSQERTETRARCNTANEKGQGHDMPGSSRRALDTSLKRCCALQLADTVGSLVPSVFLFQVS